MKKIKQSQVLDLIKNTNGKIFSATFTKKDGSEREMNCRTGVSKHLKGGQLKFDAKAKGLFSVYDLQVKNYRFINTKTVSKLKIDGTTYEVTNEK